MQYLHRWLHNRTTALHMQCAVVSDKSWFGSQLPRMPWLAEPAKWPEPLSIPLYNRVGDKQWQGCPTLQGQLADQQWMHQQVGLALAAAEP